MSKVTLASLVGVAAAGGKLALTWEDCGDASTHGHTDDVQPTEIVIGEDTAITGTGSTDKAISSGSFTMKLTASLGIKETYTGEICEAKEFKMPLGIGTVSWGGMTCPVAVGPSTVGLGVKMASVVPAALAKADLSLTAIDQDGEQALCVNTHLQREELSTRKYAKGFVRQPTNGVRKVATITDEMRAAAPASLDWSTKGATTAVKDQGDCGSCWAYSATEGIEAAVYQATGQNIKLSEQQIISCDKEDGGCDGGDLPTAFDYVQKNGGIDTQSDYPDTSYKKGKDGKCNKQAKKVVKVTGYEYAVPPCEGGACKNQKESDMMAALNEFGPLSVCVNADWDSYNQGILNSKCSGKYNMLDHCVQLVGYDTTGSKSYWKVRNSWASDWGESGFIRLPMGENACGIADEAMYVKAEMVSEEVAV